MKSFEKKIVNVSEPVTCPACRALVNKVHYVYSSEQGSSNFYFCQNCTFIFARPIFLPELDTRQMDGINNAELFNSPVLKWIYTNYFIRKEIKALRRVTKIARPRLLDIGCGTGWTTKIYSENQFEVVGLEPSEIRAEYARDHYGLKVINDYMEKVQIDEKYDVVVLRHIIEHFADPASVIQKVKSFLAPNGVLLVVVPNINCLGRYMFETDWAWVLPWHCNFFTPDSARRFLVENGYLVEEFYQTPSPLYFPGSFNRRFPLPIVKNVLSWNKAFSMALFAPLAIAGNLMGLGDNINIIVKCDN